MKTINILQTTLLLAVLFTSCKKESVSERIVGKWRIQEVFHGYFNGGDFRWSTVPTLYQSSLEFNASGGFKEVRPAGWQPAQCTGTYRLLSDGELQILSDCSSIPYNVSITVANKVLTVTYPVREGEVKEKFIKVE